MPIRSGHEKDQVLYNFLPDLFNFLTIKNVRKIKKSHDRISLFTNDLLLEYKKVCHSFVVSFLKNNMILRALTKKKSPDVFFKLKTYILSISFDVFSQKLFQL